MNQQVSEKPRKQIYLPGIDHRRLTTNRSWQNRRLLSVVEFGEWHMTVWPLYKNSPRATGMVLPPTEIVMLDSVCAARNNNNEGRPSSYPCSLRMLMLGCPK